MALVKEMMLGATRIKFMDDAYKDRTPEEIQGTLDRIAEIAMRAYQAEAWRKEREALEKAKAGNK